MSRYDFAAQRLFVDAPLAPAARIAPPAEALNYLRNVLRMREGDAIIVFNGRDGEWRAHLAEVTRRSAVLAIDEKLREQTAPGDIHYAFAPLKQARQDYMAQKAAEMGASRLIPVITRRTQARRVNEARLRANVIEAAEQCGVLTLADVDAAVDLPDFLAALEPRRLLVFCDEDAGVADPSAALRGVPPHEGVVVLIGPEGGFDAGERAQILQHPTLARLSLGPRILRADTAAVAALALVQTHFGDWRGQ